MALRVTFENTQEFILSNTYQGVLLPGHGVYYVFVTGKLGEVTEGAGKTPQEAINDRYAGKLSANDKNIKIGAYIVFDKDPNKLRQYDNSLRESIDNLYKRGAITFGACHLGNKIEGENTEALLNFNINQDLSTLIKCVKEHHGISQYFNTKTPFIPRFGQEDAIKEIVDILLKDSKCLFAGYTGIGKTLISEVAVLRYFNSIKKGGLVLVTTPIPDTFISFIRNLNDIDVGATREQKYSYITVKDWNSNSLVDIKSKTKDGEVVFLLLTAQDLFYDDKNDNTKIRGKYNKINGNIDLWVRDEGHKFYRGERTSTLLDCLKASTILDLSATPYNFLDTYSKDTIVNRDLLWGSKNREHTGLSDVTIESYETPFVELNDNIKEVYNIEEGYDPRKAFRRDNGEYILQQDIVETFRLKDDSVLPKGKNPLSVNNDTKISQISKRVSLNILPAGEDGDGAADKYPELASLLNQYIKTRYYIDAWTLEESAKKSKLSLETLIDSLLKVHPSLGILTCRKFTTGTDIPQIGHINLFDKISSPTELIQIIGRAIRIISGKNQVKLYNHCPGNEIQLAYGIAARKSSILSGESEIEYLDCIPHQLYPLNSTKPRLISSQEIISQVQEYYRSISNPRPSTNALTNALLKIDRSFYNTIDLKRLGKYKNQVTSKVKLNDPNKSKVSKITPSGLGFNSTDKVINQVRELLVAIGIEMAWVSYTNKTYDPMEILDTEEMKLMFDDYPLSIARAVLMNESAFKFFTKFLDDKKLAYNDRPFEEVHDYIFTDTDRKRKIGLVYVPMQLASNMVDKHVDKLYNEGGRNFLIENALSGSIAYVISKRYPDANIFCAEYYPYFKQHLVSIIPNVVIDNISHDDLTYSLYEDMKFDVAISNPPYQSENKTGKKGTGGNNSLYIPMVKNTINRVKTGGIVLQITPPAGIIKATEFGKPTKLLQKMIDEGSLVKIDLTIRERYFSHIGSAICNWLFIKGGKQDKVEVITEECSFSSELKDLYYLGASANKPFKKIEHEIYKKIISNKDGDCLEVVRGKKVRDKECTMARKGYPKIQRGGHSDPKQVLGFDGKFYDFMTSQLGLWLINYISRHDVMIYHNLLSGIIIPKGGFNLTDEENQFIDSEKWLNFDKNG